MPNISVEGHLVQTLLSRQSQRRTHTTTDCSIWTTKVVGDD